VHTITADRVVGGFTGQSERQLREAFAEAEEAAAAGKRVVRGSAFPLHRGSELVDGMLLTSDILTPTRLCMSSGVCCMLAASDVGRSIVQVIFLDEVDALCPRRAGNRPHEARIAAQLLALLDGAAGSAGEPARLGRQ
jgi:SpoVK/Ycf46/Vps4 family AAA+-type ATPase